MMIDSNALWKAVKANRAKLDACPRHYFGNVGEGDYSQPKKKRVCANCGGEMNDRDIITYARGYKAAGGNPDDVGKFYNGESLL